MNVTILTLGSRGDVQPYVALGRGLAAAGHAVTLTTHACWEPFVREHGLNFAPMAGDPRGTLEGEAGQMWLASDRNPFRFLRGMAEIGRPLLWQVADDCLTACQAPPADLILFAVLLALPATAIAKSLGVPAYPAYLQHVHTTATYPSALFPPMPRFGPAYNRLTYALGGAQFWRAVRPVVSAWQQERLGFPPLPRRNQFPAWNRSPQPCFYGFSPAVIPRAPEWGEHVHITGYWFLPSPAGWQPPPGLFDFLKSGPPPVISISGAGAWLRSARGRSQSPNDSSPQNAWRLPSPRRPPILRSRPARLRWASESAPRMGVRAAVRALAESAGGPT